MKEQYSSNLKIRMTNSMREEIDRLSEIYQISSAAIVRQMIAKCLKEVNK